MAVTHQARHRRRGRSPPSPPHASSVFMAFRWPHLVPDEQHERVAGPSLSSAVLSLSLVLSLSK